MKLSLLEQMALAAATGTQRVRALKTLIDREIDALSHDTLLTQSLEKTTPESLVARFLGEIYSPRSEGERRWLLGRLLVSYHRNDVQRFRALKKKLEEAKALQSMASHNHSHSHSISTHWTHNHVLSSPLASSYGAHTHTISNHTVVNFHSWAGTIMR